MPDEQIHNAFYLLEDLLHSAFSSWRVVLNQMIAPVFIRWKISR